MNDLDVKLNMIHNGFVVGLCYYLLKMAVFLVIVLCRLTEVYQHALLMETASSLNVLVNVCQITWCNNPEDNHLYVHCL